MAIFLQPLKKYATFSGRATRTELWGFYLFIFLVSIALSMVEKLIGIPGLISGLFSLAVLIPLIAVYTRRLHDVNISGWWQLLPFPPTVGLLVVGALYLINMGTAYGGWVIGFLVPTVILNIGLLVCTLLSGTEGYNDYGANPRELTE
jgi:uncharacterized membrane protein YhaH (DUF805 family)